MENAYDTRSAKFSKLFKFWFCENWTRMYLHFYLNGGNATEVDRKRRNSKGEDMESVC